MEFEKCGKMMLIIILAFVISVKSIGAKTVPKKDYRVNVGIRVQDYKWTEYTDDGKKLLEESGNLYGVNCEIESAKNIIGWRNGIHFFIGQVDYNGQTWTQMPVKTDVLYVGTKLYCDAVPAYRLNSGLWLKSFAGIGGEFWLRDLDNTKTSKGDPVRGAEEWWGCVYGRIGIGMEYPVPGEFSVFSEAGMKLPIYSRNEANFLVSGSPSAGLEPEQDFSCFGNIGFRWKQWGVKASYDALRFDRSDVVTSGMDKLYQPKSASDGFSMDVFWISHF